MSWVHHLHNNRNLGTAQKLVLPKLISHNYWKISLDISNEHRKHQLIIHHYFRKKAPSQMSGKVLHTILNTPARPHISKSIFSIHCRENIRH